MMYYIRSKNYDASFNLALEQYVFDELSSAHSYLMLWQNANAIIIGKHQNTMEEINADYVKEHGIQVIRRLSGGGAVYHDMGNINFTFVTDAGGEAFDFAGFCYPVVKVLQSLGVNAEVSGRNDMTINGLKFSGNSQYIKKGRVMHHGTILFDSDLTVVSEALRVSKDKIKSKGIKSKRSLVTNVRPHMAGDCSAEQFLEILEIGLKEQFEAQMLPGDGIDIEKVRSLQRLVYGTWEWNYGSSPAYNIHRKRYFENVGKIELYMEVVDGRVEAIAFFGDFFAVRDLNELEGKLIGLKLSEASVRGALVHVSVDEYFRNLEMEDLLLLLL